MDKIIINNKDYTSLVSKAVRYFWRTKSRQLHDSGDSSNRGAVVGGKQMDGFIELLKEVAIDTGVPADNIVTDKNYPTRLFPFFKGLGYAYHCSIRQADCSD